MAPTVTPNMDQIAARARSAGLRLTRQRRAILEVLLASDDHPDAFAIHRRVGDREPRASLSTVYRSLGALTDHGIVRRLALNGEPARFEICGDEHCHIVDVDSGDIVEFTSLEIERLEHLIAHQLGYKIVARRLELYCRKTIEASHIERGGDHA